MTTTVFFPGLGADSTLAAYHRLRDSDCVWVEWPETIPEDWDPFLEILKRQIPTQTDLCYVGISFGGLVALGMSQRIPPAKGVFLIGSLADRRELCLFFRALLPIAIHLPAFCFDPRLVPTWAIRYAFGIRDPEHLRHFRTMATRLPPHSVRTLCRLIARWHPIDATPTARIHGRRDCILRPVPGAHHLDGGHLISMTHSVEINAWLENPPTSHAKGVA